MKRRKILWSRWLMSMVAVSFFLSGCAAGTASGPTQAAAPSRMEQTAGPGGF